LWHKLREGKAQPYISGKVCSHLESLILALLNPLPDKRPTALMILKAIPTKELTHICAKDEDMC
jgi:hypothetical protein